MGVAWVRSLDGWGGLVVSWVVYCFGVGLSYFGLGSSVSGWVGRGRLGLGCFGIR